MSQAYTLPFATRILGTGSAFPKRVLKNDELTAFMDTNDEWIRERTGIHQRRISEPGNPDEHNSSLALRAARAALEMAGRKAEDLDGILVGTCSPDTTVPSTACWLQMKLGAPKAFAVDLNAACSSFVYALSMADQFVRTGQNKLMLVIGSEVLSNMYDWHDRGTGILFGDGAGAVVVERVAPGSPHRILSSHLSSDGNLWELFHVPAGGSAMPITPELIEQKAHKMKMKGREIFKVAVKTLADFAVTAVEANGLKLSDIDWVIPHQANMRIIEAVAKRLELPEGKMIVNIDRYGNTSSATVPTAFDEAVRDGRIKPGQLVLMDVFGAGLTYGSLLVRW